MKHFFEKLNYKFLSVSARQRADSGLNKISKTIQSQLRFCDIKKISLSKTIGMTSFSPSLNLIMVEDIPYYLFIAFCVVASIQFFYYLFFYSRMVFHHHKKNEPEQWPSVSVVISARNEARNLRRFLPSILEQDYPNYEVIVVDDSSQDDTDMVLKRFSKQYEHLRTTFLRENVQFSHGKKLALTVGIKAARHELLVFTDADCMAVSSNWLKLMVSGFDEDKSIVLGYGGYFQRKGFLNRIIRYDTLWIAMQFLSFAKAGVPYMGVGRNLAYKKTIFFDNKGFASHIKIDSGDDDLFINQVAKKKNTTIVVHPEATTLSRPKISFNKWIEQKRRHLSTSPHYRFGHQLLLGMEPLSRVLFYILTLLLLFQPQFMLYTAIIAACRMLFFFITIGTVKKLFNEQKLFWVSIFFDIFLPITYFYTILLNIFVPYKRWR